MHNDRHMVVLGAGSWGTALAIQLARAGGMVSLWGRDAQHMQRLQQARCNEQYLPGAVLPDNLQVFSDLEQALDGADNIMVSVPSHAFRQMLNQIVTCKAEAVSDLSLSWATKGFELDTGLLPHEVVAAVMPQCQHYAVLSGPTFASEVGLGLPTAITVAGSDAAFSQRLAQRLHTNHFIAYTSDDMTGVEIGGAVKNPLAIAAGLSDGLGFGANARIALINRGLRELSRLGEAMHVQPETLIGLAGMGDLVLTCTDNQSRNRRMGLALAKGQSIEQAAAEIGQVVEGIGATRAVYEKARVLGVRMPIIEQLYRILFDGVGAVEAVEALLERSYGGMAEHH